MKFKSRFKKGELKGSLITRTKKAFLLTPSEKKSIKGKLKKVPIKLKTYSNRVDFGNLYGFPLRKTATRKKKKVKKKQQYITVRIKR